MSEQDIETLRTIFQFHLVRLKESKDYGKIKTAPISIPFSTIKRHTTKSIASAMYISIPFSTIKSALEAVGGEPLHEFQFHLVRLKVRPAG